MYSIFILYKIKIGNINNIIDLDIVHKNGRPPEQLQIVTLRDGG